MKKVILSSVVLVVFLGVAIYFYFNTQNQTDDGPDPEIINFISNTREITDVVGSFTPEELLAKEGEFDGQLVELAGVLSSIYTGAMPPAPDFGPAIEGKEGKKIATNGVFRNILESTKLIVRGKYFYKNGFGSLVIPARCYNCIVTLN